MLQSHVTIPYDPSHVTHPKFLKFKYKFWKFWKFWNLNFECVLFHSHDCISGHFKKHMERLLKLHSSTPESVVWFLSGCLPLEALLHLRQLSLFGMISRLHNGNNLLANHARDVFASAKKSSKSWFLQIQDVFLKYSLPHPVNFLNDPPSKPSFKRLVKAAVIDHWEQNLRSQARLRTQLHVPFSYPPHFLNMWGLSL